MTITEEGSTLLDDCPPVITTTQTVYFGLHSFPPKILVYYGSGWVQVSLVIFFGGKSSQNSSKPVLIFCRSIPSVLFCYTLLKVVTYYDLTILSMSVMGFQKKEFGWGWVGGWVG